jgi:hypothetical protein
MGGGDGGGRKHLDIRAHLHYTNPRVDTPRGETATGGQSERRRL